MKMRTLVASTAATLVALGLSSSAHAEPMFLSKQYNRCATCHISPTGGGLLSAYGRSLSGVELSTSATDKESKEHEFLWGALSKELGETVHLGATFRPAHLNVDFRGGSIDRNFVMNVDLVAAIQKNGWTVYAEAGRQGRTNKADYDSFEHWVSYQSENGVGVRAGRFLPAYGVRLADHTTFTRRSLGFDMHDQVYGLEVSHTSEKRLFQATVSPGRASSLIDDDGTAAVTVSGRAQFDLTSSRSVVVSALHRAASDKAKAQTMGGVALGFAPTRRMSVWTEGNVRSVDGTKGSAYVVANETAFEAHRGLWLKFTPQLRTNPGDSSSGLTRLGASVDFLPRAHWNASILYYRDKDRKSSATTKTFLAQLFLYL